VDEADARLALLQTEINVIHDGIRYLDAITFQIKGWCVTASLAIGGFAVAYHLPALLLVGAVAVPGFFLIDCQFRVYSHDNYDRNRAIDAELRKVGIMQLLRDESNFYITGTAIPPPSNPPSLRARAKQLLRIVSEPQTFGLYLFILVCLGIEALVLL
jgi:hypothetical protein